MLVGAMLMGSGSFPKALKHQEISNMNPTNVVLIGASIGKNWNFQGLPQRVDRSDFLMEYIHGGSYFDKSEKLHEVLWREDKRPDIIVLKECAAYFPGDLEAYGRMLEGWVEECKNLGIVPIPATVVPVTRLHPLKKFLIDILKGRNPFKMGNPFKHLRNRSILEYNDALRRFARRKGLTILDLEAEVRYSETNRFLREDLATLDGLHINGKAYRMLDNIVIPVLEKARGDAGQIQ